MRPAVISDFTRCMTPPKDWDSDAGSIGKLYIRDELDCGIQFMRSAWQPEGEEVGWLAAGGSLHVKIAGGSHPVMNMSAQLPPEDSPAAIVARQILKLDKPVLRVEMFYSAATEPPAMARHAWCEVPLAGRCLSEAAAEGLRKIEDMIKSGLSGLPPGEQTG